MGDLKGRLKIVREALGKTQKEMSTLLDISAGSWQPYERGSSVPGGKVLEGLAALGINLNWLMTGDGSLWVKTKEGLTQTAKHNTGVIQVGKSLGSSISQGGTQRAYSADVQEICELLELYTTQFYRKKLKAELLKLKEQEEGR